MTADRHRGHHGAARHARRRRLRGRSGFSWAIIALTVAGTVVVTAAVVGRDRPATSSAPSHHAGTVPAGYQLSGETSPMGGQVLVTPGTRSGTARAAGVAVEGSDIAMGRIPLAYAVKPTWTLVNSSVRPVSLGKPQLDIVRGCCPGELVLGTTTLAPGAQTTLAFPLQMHPGMDGDHLFRVAVPVEGADTPLVLSVAGDFH